MSEGRRTAPPNTGTYLFVKPPDARRSRRPADRRPPSAPPQPRPLPRDSILEPLDPPSAARLRYRRPRLAPEHLDGRLVFFLDPDGDVAAAYREAARRLLDGGGDARRLWVTAPARGVGRTITALNLASALAEERRVAVIDLDPASERGLAAAFGLDEAVGVLELARIRRRDRQAPVDLQLLSDRLAALPLGDPGRAGVAAGTSPGPELRRLVDEIAEAADYLLVDGPPVLEDAAPAELVDGAVLVLRPADLASGRYEAALAALGALPVVGVLVNDAPGEGDGGGR